MAADSLDVSDIEMEDLQPNKAPLSVTDKDGDVTRNDVTENSMSKGIDGEEGEQVPLVELKRCKEWLLQQKVDHESELIAHRIQLVQDLQPSSSDDSSASDLYERISKLKDKLYSLSTAKSYKKLVLDRLICGDVLIKKLFPDTISDAPNQKQIEEMNAFADTHRRQNSLCSEILENNQVLIDSQETLDRIKKESFELKKSNRERMAKLQRLKDYKESSNHKEAANGALNQVKQQVDVTLQKISIVTNIFQALVVGSAVDWASDKEMRELVLGLGKPLDFKPTAEKHSSRYTQP